MFYHDYDFSITNLFRVNYLPAVLPPGIESGSGGTLSTSTGSGLRLVVV